MTLTDDPEAKRRALENESWGTLAGNSTEIRQQQYVLVGWPARVSPPAASSDPRGPSRPSPWRSGAHLGTAAATFAGSRARGRIAAIACRALRQPGIAGDDAGAGQRHLLPDLGLARVIGLEAGELRRGRALVAGRAQAHVDLVERAAPRRHRQRRDEALREADMPGDGVEAARGRRSGSASSGRS